MSWIMSKFGYVLFYVKIRLCPYFDPNLFKCSEKVVLAKTLKRLLKVFAYFNVMGFELTLIRFHLSYRQLAAIFKIMVPFYEQDWKTEILQQSQMTLRPIIGCCIFDRIETV